MNNHQRSAEDTRPRVGLAIQGGVIPAGAFAAGVIGGLIKERAFAKYNICAFSGTSSGALIAALCWSHCVRNGEFEMASTELVAALEKMWMYLAWPNNMAPLIPSPDYSNFLQKLSDFWMGNPFYRTWSENCRVPYTRFIMRRWIEDTIALDNVKTSENFTINKKKFGLALGAADVLKGEIKIFREDDISIEALLASGSFEEFTGLTTISSPPHNGTYLDGAWGDNPPIGELMDYELDEIWFIPCFPKAISELPHTPAGRKERQDELWQDSLVEHEADFVEFVNYWIDDFNDHQDENGNLVKGAIHRRIEALQHQHKLPGSSPNDQVLIDHLNNIYAEYGKIPADLERLFSRSNNFAMRKYKKVKIKRIERNIPREAGDVIVNAPWFIRNLMHHGCERAHKFVGENFGDVINKSPVSSLPGWWAYIPSPLNDYLCNVQSYSADCQIAQPVPCDTCPKSAVISAIDLLLPAIGSQRESLAAVSRGFCELCPVGPWRKR